MGLDPATSGLLPLRSPASNFCRLWVPSIKDEKTRPAVALSFPFSEQCQSKCGTGLQNYGVHPAAQGSGTASQKTVLGMRFGWSHQGRKECVRGNSMCKGPETQLGEEGKGDEVGHRAGQCVPLSCTQTWTLGTTAKLPPESDMAEFRF